jgi:hypothetical protein
MFPRPGSLELKASLHSSVRRYEIDGVKQLPVILLLARPALVDAVEVVKRQQLKEKCSSAKARIL